MILAVILTITVPVLLAVAFMTLAERQVMVLSILLYALCPRYAGLIAVALFVAYAVVVLLGWFLGKFNLFQWKSHLLFRFMLMLHGLLCQLFRLTGCMAPFWSWLYNYTLGPQDTIKCYSPAINFYPSNAIRGLHTSAFSNSPDMTPHPYVEHPQYPLTNEMQSKLQLIKTAWGSFYNSRMELVVGIMLGD